MSDVRTFRVTVLRVEHGLFCNVCLLPAGARVWVSFNESGVGKFVRCTCCGSDDNRRVMWVRGEPPCDAAAALTGAAGPRTPFAGTEESG